MARFASFLILLTLAGLAAPSRAAAEVATASPSDPSALCERAILVGARQGGVPTAVLHSIALSETGRNLGGRFRPWPWAINREGQGHWFATRQEALDFARASIAAGRRSFDVGCFQINYHWHGANFPSLEAMFDQETGGIYAARFLKGLEQELGSWTLAAGAYHSRTPVFAERYRARFDRILAGLGGAPLVVAEADAGEVEAGPPRPSRTRMAGRPKVITIGAAPAIADPLAARVAAIRVERGRVPPSVAAAAEAEAAGTDEAEEAGATPGPVIVSTRGAPL